ncbi:MAG: hypothetical protein OEZ21_07400 [Candidatus Bathyarchaeota archaeon]|nr:hypothetical protein [Candidatus Bathyarchaeota archaeon]MDH5746762.1 hypothetical protein [Candidatus Bathyarchaeota archaeon]
MSVGVLKPEEKVNIAIELSDVCVRVCAEGIRAEFPGIGDEELLERLRERIAWAKRWRRREV